MYSETIGAMKLFRSSEPLGPFAFSFINIVYADAVAADGGDKAAFFNSEIFSFAVFASFTAFCSSDNGFLTRFFVAGVFFAVFFFVAAAFFAFTCFVASSFLDVDLEVRFTARFTGREGSPTVLRGLPGVA